VFEMKVLSLFDGMSCLQIALNNLGVDITEYYASEIDKHCIEVTKKNYQKTVFLGEISKITQDNLPDNIDLLVGGSPCQGFSLLGNQLNLGDPRSALFFEFLRVLKEVKPKYFILENVRMKKEMEEFITNELGVEPIEINSALVSPQNRRRLYWTNIPNITQPKDKGIEGRSIFEDTSYEPATVRKAKANQKHRQIVSPNGIKMPCLTASYYKGINADGRPGKAKPNNFGDYELGKIEMLSPVECERLQCVPDNYTEGVPKTYRYKMLGNGFTVSVIEHILSHIPNI